MARFRRSITSARLGSAVRASVRAVLCSWSCSCRAWVTSLKQATTPLTRPGLSNCGSVFTCSQRTSPGAVSRPRISLERLCPLRKVRMAGWSSPAYGLPSVRTARQHWLPGSRPCNCARLRPSRRSAARLASTIWPCSSCTTTPTGSADHNAVNFCRWRMRSVMSVETLTNPVRLPPASCSGRRSMSTHSTLPSRARSGASRRAPRPRASASSSGSPWPAVPRPRCSNSRGSAPTASCGVQPVRRVKASLTHSMRSSRSVMTTMACVCSATSASRCSSMACSARAVARRCASLATGSSTASASRPNATSRAAMTSVVRERRFSSRCWSAERSAACSAWAAASALSTARCKSAAAVKADVFWALPTSRSRPWPRYQMRSRTACQRASACASAGSLSLANCGASTASSRKACSPASDSCWPRLSAACSKAGAGAVMPVSGLVSLVVVARVARVAPRRPICSKAMCCCAACSSAAAPAARSRSCCRLPRRWVSKVAPQAATTNARASPSRTAQ